MDKEKNDKEKEVEIVKELDTESIEDRVREELKKEEEHKKVLSQESERIAYLNSLDLESIEDKKSLKQFPIFFKSLLLFYI